MIKVELARWQDKLWLCVFLAMGAWIANVEAPGQSGWIALAFFLGVCTLLFKQDVTFDRDTKLCTYRRGIYPLVICSRDGPQTLAGIEIRARDHQPSQWSEHSQSYGVAYTSFTVSLVWAEPEPKWLRLFSASSFGTAAEDAARLASLVGIPVLLDRQSQAYSSRLSEIQERIHEESQPPAN